ncbi:MAG: hypothetical protein K2F94_05760, partial [Muribaculaceae bacterium]|nr:hypothetical protein [Muribaculaceae bacterium]
MRKNIIMAAALAVMTLAGASSCKSEKAGKADENTQVAEVPAPRESQFSNEDQEKAASYGPGFFYDKN